MDTADEAEQLARRIAGSVPEPISQSGGPPSLSTVPTNVSANLHSQADRIMSAALRIRTALHRIDQVI